MVGTISAFSILIYCMDIRAFLFRSQVKRLIDWSADDTLPGETLNGSTSTRRSLDHVAIHRGDSVEVTG